VKGKTMKLCAISIEGQPRVGVKTDGGIVDVTAFGFPARMNDIIEGGPDMLSRISDALKTEKLSFLNEESLKFLPATEPDKIICKGLNYKSHAKEINCEEPKNPVFFSKFNDALSAHNEPVALPTWFHRFDYEAELVIVVGKSAYNITAKEAKGFIFGYTCGNDLSARDAQFLSSQWLSGKALPGFGPVGPYIVTSDSFDPYTSAGVYCEVNGLTVQSGNTLDMIFPCFEILSAASRSFRLSPGDLIFTGTPAGVIQGKKPEEQLWLKPGDIVKITIDGIGTLTTPLV